MSKKVKSCILAVNCGSSSLKFCGFWKRDLQLVFRGTVKTDLDGQAHFVIQDHRNVFWANRPLKRAGVAAGIAELVDWLHDHGNEFQITVIVHRVVQGGPQHRQPEWISPQLLQDLQQYSHLAPGHNSMVLKAIKVFQEAFPKVPGVLCFDTGFHRDLPDQAKYFPLPAAYREQGIIRYGFHGLSYEYILKALIRQQPSAARKKIIIAHLGSGASLAAVSHGKSIDTTMGVSPLGGLVMGSRSGDLDPAILLYMLRHEKWSADELEKFLSEESGLQALAGCSDIQQLLQRSASDPAARQAIQIFCYVLKKNIGALAAALGGLDILVFTGGIGEHSPQIREYACEGLEFLGVRISHRRNAAGQRVISSIFSKVNIQVLATDEAVVMAAHAHALLNKTVST